MRQRVHLLRASALHVGAVEGILEEVFGSKSNSTVTGIGFARFRNRHRSIAKTAASSNPKPSELMTLILCAQPSVPTVAVRSAVPFTFALAAWSVYWGLGSLQIGDCNSALQSFPFLPIQTPLLITVRGGQSDGPCALQTASNVHKTSISASVRISARTVEFR